MPQPKTFRTTDLDLSLSQKYLRTILYAIYAVLWIAREEFIAALCCNPSVFIQPWIVQYAKTAFYLRRKLVLWILHDYASSNVIRFGYFASLHHFKIKFLFSSCEKYLSSCHKWATLIAPSNAVQFCWQFVPHDVSQRGYTEPNSTRLLLKLESYAKIRYTYETIIWVDLSFDTMKGPQSNRTQQDLCTRFWKMIRIGFTEQTSAIPIAG